MARYVLFICFILLGVSVAYMKTTTDDDNSIVNDIRQFVEHTMACRKIPGLTLSVVRWNTTVMAEGFGQRDVTVPLDDPCANVTSKTRFMIGSLSKAVTATLLAKIIGELKGSNRFSSEVTWDTPVRSILGDGFRLYDDVRTEQTTIKDLLTHRLGYPRYDAPILLGSNTRHSRREYCGRMFTMEPVLGFRDRFHYNNHMYTLAGCVAEVLGGDTYENLVEKYLFLPLGMNDSGISDTKMVFTDELAIPYVLNRNESGFIQLDPLTLGIFPAEPAGGVYSTADDMSSWMKMLVAEGRWNGEQVVDRTQLQETWKPVMSVVAPDHTPPQFPYSYTSSNYGLGWFLGTYNGYRWYEHGGLISGYTSGISITPDMGIAVFSSTNSAWSPGAEIVNVLVHAYVTDRLLGNEPWLNLTTACTYPEPWEPIDRTSSTENTKTRNQTTTEQSLNANLLVRNLAGILDFKSHNSNGDTNKKLNPSGSEVKDGSIKTGGWYNRYIGMYGHLMFGNITITHNVTTDDLRFVAGRFGMGVLEQVTDQEETFNCQFTGPAWYLQGTGQDPPQAPLNFNKLIEGKFQELIATVYEPFAPPVFVRGRKWTDVNSPTSGSTEVTSSTVNLMVSLLLFIYGFIN